MFFFTKAAGSCWALERRNKKKNRSSIYLKIYFYIFFVLIHVQFILYYIIILLCTALETMGNLISLFFCCNNLKLKPDNNYWFAMRYKIYKQLSVCFNVNIFFVIMFLQIKCNFSVVFAH
jgi:hypothetical protein